ncbi:alpha/beta family hydrolase [Cellulomonas sp. URHE0023]|uniref:alpha/beta hydrolase family protein n=1 Tax=Cellulomonas sp. URHE0023 TaxID=1380354 RepID=UPI003510B280
MAGLLLTPGASAGRDSPPLVAVETAVEPLPVLRVEFPNRAAGSRAPERPPVAIAHVRSTADAMALTLGVEPDAIVLGGRSFGGRMCSMAVAEGQPAAGLVLLSYPLHPPGRPDRLRIEHLTSIQVPVLAVSGERDPFGTPAELRTHLAAIPGPVTTVFVAGTHTPSNNGAVAQVVRDWLATIG